MSEPPAGDETPMAYRPLFSRLQGEHAPYALHEGVPPWLRAGLFRWLENNLPTKRHRLIEIEQRLRLSLGLGITPTPGTRRAAILRAARDDSEGELPLELANLLLYMKSSEGLLFRTFLSLVTKELDEMLRNAGSAWTVALRDGKYCLERRVSTATRDRAEHVMGSVGRAAEHLHDAWTALYGRDPNYDHAADQSVKAVEAAMRPVLLPNDNMATLGKACSHLRDAMGKYEVPAAAPEDTDNAVATVLAMMQTLWRTHRRHGTDDASVPKGTSREEAEVCLQLAITVVHMFHSGLLRRRV